MFTPRMTRSLKPGRPGRLTANSSARKPAPNKPRWLPGCLLRVKGCLHQYDGATTAVLPPAESRGTQVERVRLALTSVSEMICTRPAVTGRHALQPDPRYIFGPSLGHIAAEAYGSYNASRSTQSSFGVDGASLGFCEFQASTIVRKRRTAGSPGARHCCVLRSRTLAVAET